LNYFIHDIDPIIFSIGPINIAWYGLSFILSFIIGYLLIQKNYQKVGVTIPREHYESFIFSLLLGTILGGRFGYMIFYNLSEFLHNPLLLFRVWEGGMSFHGGLIGVVTAGLWFCRKYKYKFYTLSDPAMPLVAIGVGLVRVANFINGELYGRETDLPWAVIFARTDYLAVPRHPSQLYEALLEGFLMAIILQIVLFRAKTKGLVFWLFIGIYGVVRYLVEYIRVPDDLPMYENGMLLGYFSMGQLLSLIMFATAAVFIARLYIKSA
jgi:phosphatidylglycerol:prolipoprotein diacylglycerol transferase